MFVDLGLFSRSNERCLALSKEKPVRRRGRSSAVFWREFAGGGGVAVTLDECAGDVNEPTSSSLEHATFTGDNVMPVRNDNASDSILQYGGANVLS
jgi:hypothetical protein